MDAPADSQRDPRTRSGAGPSDAALVVAARAGEQWAREALFRRYGRMVNGMAYRLLGNDRTEVDDLVQDVFVKVIEHLGRLEQPAKFSSWLGALVVRTACNRLRRRRMLRRFGLYRSTAVDFDALPLARGVSPEVAAELREIYGRVDELSAHQRVAFVLRYMEGLELDEIASKMEISKSSVQRRLAEAHTRLGVRGES